MRGGILVLFLILEEIFPVKYVHNGLVKMAFILSRYVPSMPTFWRVFNINGCWILSKIFSFEMIILFYSSVFWCVSHWFVDIEQLLHLWVSWYILLLMYCWIQFANNLLRTFSSVFISDTGLVLVSGWSWSCRMSLEVFLPLQCTNHFYTFMKYVFVLPLMVKDYLCLSFFFHLCAWTRGLIEVTACISIFH